MKRLLSLVGVVLFLSAGQASANIVYTFSGVTFSDGGTLTGTFTTNDTFNTLLDFNITTSPGAGLGFTYTPLTAGSRFDVSAPHYRAELSDSGGDPSGDIRRRPDCDWCADHDRNI